MIAINNNVSIVNAGESEIPIGSEKQPCLKISFVFTTSYDPEFGTIELNGNMLYLGEAKELKEIIKNWQKEQKLPADLMKQVVNTVLNKCNVQALIMSRDVALPPPIPLPRANVR